MKDEATKEPSMSRFQKYTLPAFLVLGLCHLLMVVVGITEFHFPANTRWGKAFSAYGELTGSGYSYGYFAPGAYSQLRAQFIVSDHSGHSQVLCLDQTRTHEAALRLGNILEQLSNDAADPTEFHHHLASALAGSIFARYPEAHTVDVRLQRYSTVSMKQFRLGSRTTWEPEFSAKFAISKRMASQ